MLRELIQAIIDHPDGFVGEIVVADNGQGFGSMDWTYSNAEEREQSTQDVAEMFTPTYQVSTFGWQSIRAVSVNEYSTGNMLDGYVVYGSADPQTGLIVSYPKFQTEYGTYISFRNGIWNGDSYENRLRVINMPVLKSHFVYGFTGAIKNYVGVQSEQINGGLANGHDTVADGGMGTLMAECNLPTLNIMDAIWVNANPYPSVDCGPSTSYADATRVNTLIASTDPVALDYWAAEHVLIQTANLTGYSDTHTIDPDNTLASGLTEAFGVWLALSRDEINSEGYSVTTNENRMNVYVHQAPTYLANVSHTPNSQRDSYAEEYQLSNNIQLVQCHDDHRRFFELCTLEQNCELGKP
jgi:hypothetical protein